MLRTWLLVSVVLGGWAFQGSAPAAPSYDAKFTLDTDGAVYTGTTTFVVDVKGVVTGKMALTDPTEVNGMLGGTVKDGTWALAFDYAIPAQNCTGTVKGTATVPKDMKLVSGSVTIAGACTEQPMTATFSFTRRDK